MCLCYVQETLETASETTLLTVKSNCNTSAACMRLKYQFREAEICTTWRYFGLEQWRHTGQAQSFFMLHMLAGTRPPVPCCDDAPGHILTTLAMP